MSGKSSIDNELERLLSGEETELSSLYRKLPAAEPDEKLDAAVLAMAHRAVNPHLAATSRADRRAPARPKPWMFALGSAAGLVLAAGVAWQLRSTIQQDGDEVLQRANAPASEGVITVTPMERAAKPDATATAPTAAPASTTEMPALAAPKPQAMEERQRAAAQPLGDDALRAKLDLEKSRKRADEKISEDVAADKEQERAARDRREEHGVTEYTLPAGAAGPAPRPAPFPADAAKQSEVGAIAGNAAASGHRGGEKKFETVTVSGAPIRAIEVETATAPSREQDSVERKAAIATGGNHAEPAPAREQAKDAAAAKALKSAPASAAPSRSATLQNNARLYPEAWIGVMQQLLRDGRREEARENLDLFRRKYPDHKLPADLQALVDTP